MIHMICYMHGALIILVKEFGIQLNKPTILPILYLSILSLLSRDQSVLVVEETYCTVMTSCGHGTPCVCNPKLRGLIENIAMEMLISDSLGRK